MAKYIIGGIFLILIAGGAYYLLAGSGMNPAPEVMEPVPVVPTTQTYSTSTFSITYPVGWSVNDAYAYTGVSPTKPISGVQITIPGTMATGTNLSADSYVSVEWLPRATTCRGDIYVLQNVRATELTVGLKTWSVASTTGAAAGNRYEESVFAAPDSKPCTAVRYYIHSTNIDNYPEGTVREFDRAALVAEFDKIRDSLILNSSSAPAPADITLTP